MNSTSKLAYIPSPRYFGISGALWTARIFHVLMLVLLVGFGFWYSAWGKLSVAGGDRGNAASGLRALPGIR